MIEYKDKVIPLAAISVSSAHRAHPISDKDRKEIGDSLARFGQLQQLVVRPVKGKRKDMYELLAGRMRMEAMKAEGIKMARCAVVNCDDRTAELISIVENLHRRSLDASERRKDIARYAELIAPEIQRREAALAERHKVAGTTPKRGRPKKQETLIAEATARDLKIKKQEALEVLQLQKNLCPSACRAFDLGKITKEQARILSRLKLEDQREELQRMLNESQAETRERKLKEAVASAKIDPTEAVVNLLKRLITAAQNLTEKSEELLSYVDSHHSDIKWDVLRSIDTSALIKAGNTLLDVEGMVQTG